MTDLPSYHQLQMIPPTIEHIIDASSLDWNNHVTVLEYLRLGMTAMSRRSDELGFGPVQIPAEQLTTFTAEQHTRYFAELVEGQSVSLRVRLVDRGRTGLHLITFLVDEDNMRLAFTLEDIILQVDLRTRRPTSISESALAGVDAELALHRALPWAPPISGSVGVRRS